MNITFLKSQLAGELFDIETASHVKPDWWREMPFTVDRDPNNPSSFTEKTTMKTCPAIHSVFNMGYVIKSPCDFEVISNNEGYAILFPHGENPYLSSAIKHGHTGDQYENLSVKLEDYHDQTIKIYTQIYARSEQPCNYFLTNPHWSYYDRGIVMMDAVLQTSGQMYGRIGHQIIPNFLVKRNSYTLIKQGDPLIQITPFSPQKVTADVVTLRDEKHIQAFDNIRVRFFQRLLYTVHSKYRGFLKHFMFKNSYSLREKDAEEYIKWIKRKWG